MTKEIQYKIVYGFLAVEIVAVVLFSFDFLPKKDLGLGGIVTELSRKFLEFGVVGDYFSSFHLGGRLLIKLGIFD